MGKYTNINRKIRNTAIKETGKILFNDDDSYINKIINNISEKARIPARELHRQYRHYRNRLQVAVKEHTRNASSVAEIALKHQVCAKLLTCAINQSEAS